MRLTRPQKPSSNQKQTQDGRFKDKLKKKLQDARKIDEDPSAFIEPDSQDLGYHHQANQQNASPAFGQQPANYFPNPMHMYTQYMMYPNGQVFAAPGVQMMMPQMAGPPAGYFPVNGDPKVMIEHQKQVLIAELREIENQKQKVRNIEAENNVNTRFKKTDDILNKYNEDYELEESQIAYARPAKSKEEILESIQKLDSLLQKKKGNQPIPFIDQYTPSRKKPVTQEAQHNGEHDWAQDSLEAAEARDASDAAADLHPHVQSKDVQQGYMNKKKRMVEHRAAAEPKRKEEKQQKDSKVIIENEHGVVKISNKANLQSLFD